MANEIESDVKPSASDSSSGADVIEQSSSSQTAQKDVKQQSLNEYLTDNVEEFKTRTQVEEESTDDKADKDRAEAAESDSENEPDQEEKAKPDKKESQDDDKKEDVVDEKKDEAEEGKEVPYERFQEVNTKWQEAQREVETLRVRADGYDKLNGFCQQHGIAPEQFTQMLKVQALLNSDPEAALKELVPIVESLQGFVGDKLPTDLQDEVDKGDLTVVRAKEIAQLRARTQFGTKKSEFDKAQWERQQQADMQRQVAQAAQSWETAKRSSDPDYKPKAKETDSDGKWEMVKDKYIALLNQTDANGNYINVVRSTQDMTTLLEKAYVAVNGFFKRLNGTKTSTRRVLSSNGSSTISNKKTIEQADTMAEAIQIQLASSGRR